MEFLYIVFGVAMGLVAMHLSRTWRVEQKCSTCGDNVNSREAVIVRFQPKNWNVDSPAFWTLCKLCATESGCSGDMPAPLMKAIADRAAALKEPSSETPNNVSKLSVRRHMDG